LDYYELARGPLATLAFFIFFIGVFYRFGTFYFKGTNPKMLYPRENLTNGFKSIFFGIIPFATRFMRQRPVFTVITFVFHLGVLLVPFFFTAHIVLLYESFGIVYQGIGNTLADILTLCVLAGSVFFFVRRLMIKELKLVTTPSDYILLILIFIAFLTGFFAFHQIGPYRPMLILHILCSDVLIAMIPFSRLWHMIAYPFSRYYMGADFGPPMKAQDW
jgi:nitrate reductase gamma subunit